MLSKESQIARLPQWGGVGAGRKRQCESFTSAHPTPIENRGRRHSQQLAQVALNTLFSLPGDTWTRSDMVSSKKFYPTVAGFAIGEFKLQAR